MSRHYKGVKSRYVRDAVTYKLTLKVLGLNADFCGFVLCHFAIDKLTNSNLIPVMSNNFNKQQLVLI